MAEYCPAYGDETVQLFCIGGDRGVASSADNRDECALILAGDDCALDQEGLALILLRRDEDGYYPPIVNGDFLKL